MNQNSIVTTAYDTGHYATYIQQRLQQTTTFIEQQLSELTGIMQSRVLPHTGASPNIPSGAGKSAILSIVPATNESSLPTLLFTQETQNTFLRAALGRDLFFRLKKVAKRWYANVEESERRHATRISQDVAKAVTDGRVSNITEKHLEAYRTRIQQTYQVSYHIPTEELRKAFSRKIRVYLQNTKSKHEKWIKEYKGTIDIRAPVIIIEQTGRDDNDASVKDEESDEEKDQHPPIKKLKTENQDNDLGHYSSIPTQHADQSASGMVTDDFYNFYCVVPANYFTEKLQVTANHIQLQLNDTSRKTFFNYLHQICTSLSFPLEFLTQPHIVYICYCIFNHTADRSLGQLCKNLITTAVRLMAACFAGNESSPRELNPIQCSIEIRKKNLFPSDPDPKDEIFYNIISTRVFSSASELTAVSVFTAFVDYAIHMNYISRENWKEILNNINHPFTFVSNGLTELGIAPFPQDYEFNDLGNFIILLMYCSIEKKVGVQTRSLTPNTLILQSIFNNICDTVLEDIINPESNELLDRTPATYYSCIKQWQMS